jgi:hypothetical protein
MSQNNAKLLNQEWVLYCKIDGEYRARYVAKGFSQNPGKDYQENCATMISDTNLNLILNVKTISKLEAFQFVMKPYYATVLKRNSYG